MAESMPPTPEQMRQLHRDVFEKVLDKAAGDPAWKQRLLDDPQAAMREANFPEFERVEEMRQKEEEVRGGQFVVDHYDPSTGSLDPGDPRPCGVFTCGLFTCVYSV